MYLSFFIIIINLTIYLDIHGCLNETVRVRSLVMVQTMFLNGIHQKLPHALTNQIIYISRYVGIFFIHVCDI